MFVVVFLFKQKTAYEMRISDWSSDVCSSDLGVADTWYSSALADALSGEDLQPGFIDINSQFSSDFSFYLGLDGNTPAGQVNFLDVVMHEFGHGLGFQNFENEANGTFLAGVQDRKSTRLNSSH